MELARALAEQASFSKAPKSSEALADVEEPVQGTSDPSEGVTPAVEASQAPSKAAATDQSVSSQQIPASQQGASLGEAAAQLQIAACSSMPMQHCLSRTHRVHIVQLSALFMVGMYASRQPDW